MRALPISVIAAIAVAVIGCGRTGFARRLGFRCLDHPRRTQWRRVIVVHDLLPRRCLRRAAILFIEHFAQVFGHEVLSGLW